MTTVSDQQKWAHMKRVYNERFAEAPPSGFALDEEGKEHAIYGVAAMEEMKENVSRAIAAFKGEQVTLFILDADATIVHAGDFGADFVRRIVEVRRADIEPKIPITSPLPDGFTFTPDDVKTAAVDALEASARRRRHHVPKEYSSGDLSEHDGDDDDRLAESVGQPVICGVHVRVLRNLLSELDRAKPGSVDEKAVTQMIVSTVRTAIGS